jgi:AcrR family transcriptional regulator
MARPRSDDRRDAILDAAMRIIAREGLGASTASIAKAAKISAGSLFTYFPTKSALLNQLYVDLKTEMAASALNRTDEQADLRAQMAQMWAGWLGWAGAHPEKRRALAQLAVSDEITSQSREIGHRAMAGAGALMERVRANGPMRDMPLGLVAAMLNALAEASIDFAATDPANAQTHHCASFNAAWRMLS